MNEKIVEAVAESLWQAESRRAADRARLTSWPEESEKTREGWRFLARAAITAYQAEAWQPIETAPKDGSEIILGGKGWSGSGFYHDGSECKRSDGGWFSEEDRNNLLIAREMAVTHWHPLPIPPSDLGET